MTLRWFAIEGLVGAGKTTTAQLTASSLDMCPVLEQTDAHPFLAAYYRDPQRFAIETELVFMAIHLHQIKRASGSVVADFSPAKNLIYAERQLKDEDLTVLKTVDRHLWRDMPRPTMALFLDVPPSVCLERIRRRGRPFEQGITVGTLESLREGYLANLSALAAEVVRIELTGDESRELVAKAASDRIAPSRP